MAGSYRDLIAWQKAMILVKEIYLATQDFSKEEIYGLKTQLQRAAVSVPSNIAEGQARYSRSEFQHFLNNARGSLAEVETQIILASDLGYLGEKEAEHPAGEIVRAGTNREWPDRGDKIGGAREPVLGKNRAKMSDQVFLSTGNRVLSTALFHPQLPEQERIHIRKFFNLFGHGFPRAMAGFAFNPQQDRPRAA